MMERRAILWWTVPVVAGAALVLCAVALVGGTSGVAGSVAGQGAALGPQAGPWTGQTSVVLVNVQRALLGLWWAGLVLVGLFAGRD